MTNPKALLSCPFCGCEDVRLVEVARVPGWTVACNLGPCAGNIGYRETAEKAVAAWNRRADLPSLDGARAVVGFADRAPGEPHWLTGDEARELREEFPEDRYHCEECDLPSWVCHAITEEAIRRGGTRHNRGAVDAEARRWISARDRASPR